MRRAAIASWGAAVAAWLFLAGMYACFSLDFPLFDQWEFPLFLAKYYDGTLGWHDFWDQHNEHRILFPRVIMLSLAAATRWNIRAELAANFVLGTALFGVYIWAARRSLRAAGAGWGAIPGVLGLLVFSLGQWQNWFLGWQLQVFLSVTAALTALILLARASARSGVGEWMRWAAAALLGLIASCSFANGMLVWPIGALLLFPPLRPPAPRPWLRCSAWCLTGALVFAAYLCAYRLPVHPDSDPSPALVTFNFLRYATAYLGQPLVNEGLFAMRGAEASFAGVLGAIAWALFLVRLRRQLTWNALAPCFALGAYSLASAALTGHARLGYGPEQALSSRYVTLANPLWVALALLVHMAASRSARPRGYQYSLALMALLIGAASLCGAYRWTERYHAYGALRPALIEGRDPERLEVLYPPGGDILFERRALCGQYGLSIFGAARE